MTLRILSVLCGSGSSAAACSRAVARAPLNMAMNAQKSSVRRPWSEKGRMWAEIPVLSLHKRHCAPSREMQAVRTFLVRLERPLVLDVWVRFGGGTAVVEEEELPVSDEGVEGSVLSALFGALPLARNAMSPRSIVSARVASAASSVPAGSPMDSVRDRVVSASRK